MMMAMIIGASPAVDGALAAQAPTHREVKQTRGGRKLSISATSPTLADCRFRLDATVAPPVLPQPGFVWTRLSGTGSFQVGTPEQYEGTPAFLTPFDFGENLVQVRETVTGLNRNRALQLNQCSIEIRPEGSALLLSDEELNLTPRICPDVPSGAQTWTIKNSAGTTLATSQTRDLLFGTSIIDTFRIELENALSGKSCVAPAKSITVGRLDALTWVDQTNPNNPLPSPQVVQGKRAILVFTITFSPATPFAKENVGFFVEVVEGSAGVVISLTEDVAAGGTSSRVFRADIDNQTNDFRNIVGKATLRGVVQKVTPSIQFNPF